QVTGDAAGVYNNQHAGDITLHNTLAYGNIQGSTVGKHDVWGKVNLGSGNNLIGHQFAASGAWLAGTNNNLVGSQHDPVLAPLGDYGGPTETYALLPGSPAIEGGDPSVSAATDQRGFQRVGLLDIGAFEADASIVVSTTADEDDGDYSSGDLSLREALELASVLPGEDKIEFDPSVFGSVHQTITLGSVLGVDSDVTIDGPGADLLTISGGYQHQVLAVSSPYSPFGPPTRIVAEISGLTLQGGVSAGNALVPAAAGVEVTSADLDLQGVRVFDNHSSGPAGGLLLTDANVSVLSSEISENSGAAIYIDPSVSSSLDIINTTISSNWDAGIVYGGVIPSQTQTLKLINSTIADNGSFGLTYSLHSGLSSITVNNTIVMQNGGVDIANPLNGAEQITQNNSLIGTQNGGGLGPFTTVGAIDIGLGALAFNGGPTRTQALDLSSIAIDAGDSSLAVDSAGAPLTTDQNGFDRYRDGNGDSQLTVDIGAVEYQGDGSTEPGDAAYPVHPDASDEPWVTTNSFGESVVVWRGAGPEGVGVYAQQIHSGSGQSGQAPVSEPRLVSVGQSDLVTSDLQAAIDDQGNYAVLYRGADAAGASSDLYLRRYRFDGAPIDPLPVQVSGGDSAGDDDGLSAASLVGNDAGRLLVAWQNSVGDLVFRRFTTTGLSLDKAAVVAVDNETGGTVGPASERFAALRSDGGFYLLWKEEVATGDGEVEYQVRLQEFSSGGGKLGSPARVGGSSDLSTFDPVVSSQGIGAAPHDVVVDEDGRIAVAWTQEADSTYNSVSRESRLLVRFKDPVDGWGDAVVVAEGYTHGEMHPSLSDTFVVHESLQRSEERLAVDARGRLGVSYRQTVIDSPLSTITSDLYLQWLEPGEPASSPIALNQFGQATGVAHSPSLAADALGNFLLAGVANNQVYIQSFALPQPVTVDDAGVLTVDGPTAGDDEIRLATRLVRGERMVALNGVATRIQAEEVTKIIVNGSAFGDRIDLARVDGVYFTQLASVAAPIEVYAGAGADVVTASPLGGSYYGEAGDDRIIGSTGVDLLFGGEGDDTLSGHDGDDHLSGDAGSDTLLGGAGDDTLRGGAGDDELYGGAGDDTLYGDQGSDTLDAGTGAIESGVPASENVDGGLGDDVYVIVDHGVDQITTRTYLLADSGGVDTLDFSTWQDSSGVVVDLQNDNASEWHFGPAGLVKASGPWWVFDNVVGTEHNDRIYGNDSDNTLVGGAGDDELTGLRGDDLLQGQSGDDTYLLAPASGSSVRIEDTTGNNDIDARGYGVTPIAIDTSLVEVAQPLGSDTLTLSGLTTIEDVQIETTPAEAAPPDAGHETGFNSTPAVAAATIIGFTAHEGATEETPGTFRGDEHTLLRFEPVVDNPDGASLTFALGRDTPSNVSIDPDDPDGVVTWTPDESQGSASAYTISVLVTTAGDPPVRTSQELRVFVDEAESSAEPTITLDPIRDTGTNVSDGV
ncbi:MAG: choice-of-anchor Q domain-containing protein, partial [Planctomycetota bacterium]